MRKENNMNLQNFLKLYKYGTERITIEQSYKDQGVWCHRTFFEERYKEDILKSPRFKEIAKKQVDYFNIIGGFDRRAPLELCIELKQED